LRPSRGSPIGFEAEGRLRGATHLYRGTLAEPGAFVPIAQVHSAEQLPGFEVRDELPRFSRSGDT
jgi:hypothetical protein